MSVRPNNTLKLHSLPPAALQGKLKSVLKANKATASAARKSLNTGPKPKKARKPKRPKKDAVVKLTFKAKAVPRSRLTSEEKIGRAAVGSLAAKRTAQAVLKVGRKNVGAVARVAGRVGARGAAGALASTASAALGAVALAGIAAFFVTRAIINQRAKTKAQLQENAFQLGQAYRKARLKAEKQQGRPLSADQHQLLRDAFQRHAEDLGIRTPDGWNLRKLR